MHRPGPGVFVSMFVLRLAQYYQCQSLDVENSHAAKC